MPVPSVQTGCSVGADDEEEFIVRFGLPQFQKGVDRVGRPPSHDLPVTGRDPLEPIDGSDRHGQTVLRRGKLTRSPLLPGLVGHHKDHSIQNECRSNLHRSREMTDMRWIECASENPEAAAYWGHSLECMVALRVTCGRRRGTGDQCHRSKREQQSPDVRLHHCHFPPSFYLSGFGSGKKTVVGSPSTPFRSPPP